MIRIIDTFNTISFYRRNIDRISNGSFNLRQYSYSLIQNYYYYHYHYLLYHDTEK